MGKKINLAGSRFGMTGASNPIPEAPLAVATAPAKAAPHISALKRLGSATAETVAPVTEAATRFMVTVTNERSAPKPNGDAPLTKLPTRQSAGSLTTQAQTPPMRKQTGMNFGAAKQNVVQKRAESSIEIIDLEAEPSRNASNVEKRPMANKAATGQPPRPNMKPRNSIAPPNQTNPPIKSRLSSANRAISASPQNRQPHDGPHNKTHQAGDANFPNRKRKNPLAGYSFRDDRLNAALAPEPRTPLPGGRRRLFVAGFPKEGVKEEEIKEVFEKFGKVSECWFKFDKGFGFITMDSKLNAEKAKLELDRSAFKGRSLNVRLASQSAVLKVSNLGDYVTNEILRSAFEFFGELERVCVACDYHLNPLGFGYVEFSNKKRAEMAVRRITECPFILTKAIKPVSVKPLDDNDEEDGLSFNHLRSTPQMAHEYSEPPRFLDEGTFEYDVAMKWKMQYLFEERQREHLEQQLKESRERLELEVDDMYKNHKAWILREELKRRQEELDRLERFQSSDNLTDSKRAYLDRAAEAREEQFRREEETFLKHQEQLKRNAEIHLVQEMSAKEQPHSQHLMGPGGAYQDMDLRYGSSNGIGIGGLLPMRGVGGSSQQFYDLEPPPRNSFAVQELMMGGGGGRRSDGAVGMGGGGAGGDFDYDFVGVSSAKSRLSMPSAANASTYGRGSASGGGGGLSSNAAKRMNMANESSMSLSPSAGNNYDFDIQPIRRQQHY